MEKKIMENNEILKKVLLQMNYDSKKTLSENYENINLLKEDDVLRTGKIVKSPGYSKIYEPLKLNKPFTFTVHSTNKSNNYSNEFIIGGTHKETGLLVNLKYVCGDENFKLDLNPKEKLPISYTNDMMLAQGSEISIPTLKTSVDKEHCGVVGSGSKGNDNMAGEEYWGVLLKQLNDAGYAFKETEGVDTKNPLYWWGPFIIQRYGPNFITYKKGDSSGNAKISVLSYKGKYSGQVITDILLATTVIYFKDETPNLKEWIDYLYKTTEKTKEIPGTGSKKQNEVPRGGLQKYPKDTKKSKGEFIDCTGTYTYGCKSPKIGEAQKCMKDQGLYSYKVDNEFGLKTYDAIKKKLNKTSFTDADVNVICGKKQDEKPPLDFEGGGGGSGTKEEDYVWNGEFI